MKLPRHEPEVIQAGAQARWGDDQKVPTTAVKGVKCDGVSLSSRYSKATELEMMARMVESVPSNLRPLVEALFCDSQAGACYTVDLKPCDADQAAVIGRWMEIAAGGHNGLVLLVGNNEIARLDPYWPEDESGAAASR